jgi:S1-C subfamily serine protease
MPRNPLFDDPIFREFFGGEDSRVSKALGSGVIVDASGLVVTNFHVIEGMTEVKVALSDKREFEAQIVLRDPRTDLAVLRLIGGDNFAVLELGDSDALVDSRRSIAWDESCAPGRVLETLHYACGGRPPIPPGARPPAVLLLCQ